MRSKIIFSIIALFLVLNISMGFCQEAPDSGISGLGDISEKEFALGLALGGNASPGMFTLKANADYIFDGLFSLGPFVQFSTGSDRQFFQILFDGKFRFNLPGVPQEIKFMGLAGAGYIFRSQSLFNSHDFVAHGGIGTEYFFMENLSGGVELLASVTSSSIDRFLMSIFAGISYYI